MHAIRRVILLLVPVLAVGLAVWGLWTLGSRATTPVVTLSDGTLLRVEALTVGTNHEFRVGVGTWGRILDRLPRALRSVLGPSGYASSHTTRRDVGYLWITRYDPVAESYVNPGVDSFRVLDATGQEFPMGNRGSGGNARFRESHIRLDFFPRRAPDFRVRFIAQGQTHEVTVRNPVLDIEYPTWSPEPLPQTREVDGFTFTLDGLKARSWGENRWYCSPEFKVTQGGQDRTDWWRPTVYFVDATGNREHGGLSRLEAAWKMEVNFFPTARYPFAAETVRPLMVTNAPAAGDYRVVEGDLELRKQGLELTALTGPGSYSIRNGVFESAHPWEAGMSGSGSSSSSGSDWSLNYADPKWRVVLVMRGPATGAELMPPMHEEGRKLLLRVRDASGTILEAPSTGGSSSSDGTTLVRKQTFSLDLEGKEGLMSFDLVPVTATTFEFMIKPPEFEE